MTYEDEDVYKSGGVNVLNSFRDIFNYVRANYVGAVYGTANKAGEALGNQKLLEKLKSFGIWPVIDQDQALEVPQVLRGETFVITGTLPSWTRDEAKDIIERYGGKVTGSVSSKTDYLLVGESPGSKLAKAQSLEVKIIDEAGLRALLADAEPTAE